MPHKTAVVLCNGIRYHATAHVDEESGVVYEVTIWHSRPAEQDCPLIERFEPVMARTLLQEEALDVIYAMYGICPIIENI